MSFRLRQKMYMAVPCVPLLREDKTLENGEIIHDLVATDKELPDPELFRIENLRNAGVDLQEVNSKVLGSKSFDVSKILTSKKVEIHDSKEN